MAVMTTKLETKPILHSFRNLVDRQYETNLWRKQYFGNVNHMLDVEVQNNPEPGN